MPSTFERVICVEPLVAPLTTVAVSAFGLSTPIMKVRPAGSSRVWAAPAPRIVMYDVWPRSIVVPIR